MKLLGSLVITTALVAATCPDVEREEISGALSEIDRHEDEVTEATCTLMPTILNPHQDLFGDFVFASDANNYYDAVEPDTSYTMKYNIDGLSDGDHTYHVHNVGDLWAMNGDGAEMHFIGTAEERAEIGLVQNSAMPTYEQRKSYGEYVDEELTLNFGVNGNSILGRTMIVHDVGGDDPLERAAQCVIGITGIKTSPNGIIGMQANKVAMATIFPTSPTNDKKNTSKDYTKVTGWVETLLNSGNNLDVKGLIYGLPAGEYHIHVNQLGKYAGKNPLTDNGESSGAFFVGVVDAQREKAGYIHGKGSGHTGSAGDYIITSNGVGDLLTFAFEDKYIKLNGANNIIGRMLVILEKGDGGADAKAVAVGQGVIGVTDRRLEHTYKTTSRPTDADAAEPPASAMVTQASTLIKGGAGSNVHGYVTFDQLTTGDPKGPGVRIRYSIFGLPPTQEIQWHVHVLGDGTATTGPDINHFMGKGVARRNPDLVGQCAQETEATCVAQAGCSWVQLSGDSTVSECFSPEEQEAGLLGDMRTISSDASGVAKGVLFDAWISLNEWNSIVGRSLVIHNNVGTRIGWGVIGRVAENDLFTARGGQKVTEAVCNFPSGGNATLVQAGNGVTISNLVGQGATASAQVQVHEWGEVLYPRYSGNQWKEAPCQTITATATSITVANANLNNMLGRSLSVYKDGKRTSDGCVIGIKAEDALTYNIYPPPEPEPEPSNPGPLLPPKTEDDDVASAASNVAVFTAAVVVVSTTMFL